MDIMKLLYDQEEAIQMYGESAAGVERLALNESILERPQLWVGTHG